MIEVLFRSPAATAIEDRIFARDETLHVPHLLDLEVIQVLRRYVRAREISAARGGEMLLDLADMPLTRYAHHPHLPRIWDLRDSATAYDAVYIALAEALDAPLITCDSRMASIRGHGALIELL